MFVDVLLFIVVLHEEESVYLITTSSVVVPEHVYIQIHILLKIIFCPFPLIAHLGIYIHSSKKRKVMSSMNFTIAYLRDNYIIVII